MAKASYRSLFLKSLYLKGGIFILAFGFVLGQFISPLIAYALPNLSVEIYANPSSGNVPLNDVDLTANVSGTATGDITYKFDCTNNGSWEKTITTSSTSYTATNLCDYSSAGNYAAKISVEREGLVFQGTTAIFVDSGNDLSVVLYANPFSGNAPLNNVDLTANVSGAATGDITYRFDCTNNGTWERTHTTGSTSYTAHDLCDYSSSGSYTAKVKVERGGLSFQGTTAIVVYEEDEEEEASLSIDKRGRNKSQDKTSWVSTVYAEPDDIIEFRIIVTSRGDETAEDVIVKDSLPSKMEFYDDLEIDGRSSSKDIEDGIDIGDLRSGRSKTITYEVQIDDEDRFSSGTTDLTNLARVWADNVSQKNDLVRVKVTKEGEEKSALFIAKRGRNVTQGKTLWVNTISAKPGEIIEFRIKITSTGDERAEDVVVSDILPSKMNYIGSLKIDGDSVSGDIEDGINIGDLRPDDSKIITFKALLASEDNFNFGITNLTNTGKVRADNVSLKSESAIVKVTRTQVAGATTVVTGAMDYIYLSLLMVFLLSICLYLIFQRIEYSQNRFTKRLLRRYYVFKSFVFPGRR